MRGSYFDPSQPFVDKDGKLNSQPRELMLKLRPCLTGTGSPEGVVDAPVTQEYMDLAGVAGAIKYIKRDASNGSGDTRFGWILI